MNRTEKDILRFKTEKDCLKFIDENNICARPHDSIGGYVAIFFNEVGVFALVNENEGIYLEEW